MTMTSYNYIGRGYKYNIIWYDMVEMCLEQHIHLADCWRDIDRFHRDLCEAEIKSNQIICTPPMLLPGEKYYSPWTTTMVAAERAEIRQANRVVKVPAQHLAPKSKTKSGLPRHMDLWRVKDPKLKLPYKMWVSMWKRQQNQRRIKFQVCDDWGNFSNFVFWLGNFELTDHTRIYVKAGCNEFSPNTVTFNRKFGNLPKRIELKSKYHKPFKLISGWGINDYEGKISVRGKPLKEYVCWVQLVKYHGCHHDMVASWKSFTTFRNYIIANGWTSKTRIGRVDCSKPYGPGNITFGKT